MLRILIAASLFLLSPLTHAQTVAPGTGEALYNMHCSACHTAQVHWRENKLSTNWSTLRAQVRRWQGNQNLQWGESDIDAVARYLNTLYYRYPDDAGVVGLNTAR